MITVSFSGVKEIRKDSCWDSRPLFPCHVKQGVKAGCLPGGRHLGLAEQKSEMILHQDGLADKDFFQHSFITG